MGFSYVHFCSTPPACSLHVAASKEAEKLKDPATIAAISHPSQLIPLQHSLRLRHIRLRRERRHLTQAANPAQQELQMPIRCRRLILRDHVAAEVYLDICETPLGVRDTHDAAGSDSTEALFFMVWDVEGGRRRGLEALRAIPRHVLDHHSCAVGNQDHIEQTVPNHCVVQALDDRGEDGEARRG